MKGKKKQTKEKVYNKKEKKRNHYIDKYTFP
jgi:hypothetical protein